MEVGTFSRGRRKDLDPLSLLKRGRGEGSGLASTSMNVPTLIRRSAPPSPDGRRETATPARLSTISQVHRDFA
jgi:hypothetical protein